MAEYFAYSALAGRRLDAPRESSLMGMGRTRPKRRERNRTVVFIWRFFTWLFRGAALYALIWFAMRYITGRPWLGYELLWSFLIVAGAVVMVGLWGDTFSDTGQS